MAPEFDDTLESNLRFLAERLTDPKDSKRLYSVTFLASLGDKARPVLPDVMQLMNDRVAEVRRMAVVATGEIGGDPEVLLTNLVPLLKDSEPSIVRRVVTILGSMGEHARPAVASLLPLMKDPRPLMRRVVLLALGDIGSTTQKVLAVLIDSLGDRDMKTRAVASAALRKMGGRITPRLIRELDHSEPEVRRRLVRLLGMNPRGEEALCKLDAMRNDPDADVRHAVGRALAKLEPATDDISNDPMSSGEVRALIDEVLFANESS